LEEPLQLGQQGREDVLRSEIDKGALFDLAVLAVGLDDADVLMDGAVGRRDFDGAEAQGDRGSRRCWRRSRPTNDNFEKSIANGVTTLLGPDRIRMPGTL
jgi:hypothetical protein